MAWIDIGLLRICVWQVTLCRTRGSAIVMPAIWFRHLALSVYSVALETAMQAVGISTLYFLAIHAAIDFGPLDLVCRQAREASL
jgi:hypothetical protein